jgi:hypothetical protein
MADIVDLPDAGWEEEMVTTAYRVIMSTEFKGEVG